MSDGFAIREERAGDEAGVDAVLRSSFPTDAEARLVAQLRADGDLRVSLVAERSGERAGERSGQIVGYIAFSPVTLDGEPCGGVGLAPVAVLPGFRSRGIGGTLVSAGLVACRGESFCVVLGEPRYYGRFGFRPAARWGLRSVYDAGDAFMATALPGQSLPKGGGLVRYSKAFDAMG